MPWSEPTYSLTLDVTGIRFYGSDARIITAEAALSAESDVQVLSLEILKPQIVISGETTVNVSASKDTFAQASVDGLAISVTVGTEIVKALIAPSASVSLSVSGTKIAYADSAVSGESDASATALEILLGSSAVDIESDLTATAYEILHGSSAISAESDASATALEILFGSSSPSVESNTSVTALEILFASSNISIESNTSATAYKIAYSSTTIAIDGDASITSLKIAYANAETSALCNTTVVGTEILFANVSISGLAVTVTVAKEILFINPQPTGAAFVLSVDAIRFSPSLVEDTQSIRTLLLIDGKPLTEHGRGLSSSVIQPMVENINWNSRRTRYYRTSSGRRLFNISWDMLPSKRSQTVDTKFGRDKIKEIADDPDVHVLTVINNDTDGLTPYSETQYNVLVKSYNESLVRRDINNDMYLWQCSLQLEEV